MINSFRVNVDTNNINHTSHLNEGGIEIDVGQGEIKYILQNVRNIKKIDEEQKKTDGPSNLPRPQESFRVERVIPLYDHLSCKLQGRCFRSQGNWGIATKLNLALVRVNPGKISYKDKIETKFTKSKYSYLKHVSKSNMLHFYHHQCELKLVNNVTSSIRFFQESFHKEKDFTSKFSIHIFPEPRLNKYCNYFNFFQIFTRYTN